MAINMQKHNGIPVELVFAPEWWNKHYGITFDEDFFFHPERRVRDERTMRRALRERFPDLYGWYKDEDRPVVGAVHLAAGFAMSAILGCDVHYHESAPPDVVPCNLSDEEFRSFIAPDLRTNPMLNKLRRLMDNLEGRFGYVEGDINWGGVLNLALDLRGQSLFLDLYDDPSLLARFFEVITETVTQFLCEIRSRTGTTSISVNRGVLGVDPAITLHSNCSVQMISPAIYEEHLLKYDVLLAERFQPYGIHHCGDNMHKVAASYARVPGAVFFDVGWGSDIAACRAALPDAFLNIRLSPVKLAVCTPSEVQADLTRLVEQAAPYDKVGICCINMDSDVPDANVQAIIDFAASWSGVPAYI